MRASLKPRGTMTMIVWRGVKDNPWLGLAEETTLKFLPPPGENLADLQPGTIFHGRHRRGDRTAGVAGYQDIAFEQVDAQVLVGKDLDDAVAFQLAIGPAGEVYGGASRSSPRSTAMRSLKTSRLSSPAINARTAS